MDERHRNQNTGPPVAVLPCTVLYLATSSILYSVHRLLIPDFAE